MDDLLSDIFPFFEYPLVENQTEANINVIDFDRVPDHLRQPNLKSREKTQVNELGTVVPEHENTLINDDILLGSYNQDLESNSAGHFMDLSNEGFLLPQNLQSSSPSGQHIMDLDINVGGFRSFPPQNLQSNPSGYLMDMTYNAGGYDHPPQNLQSNVGGEFDLPPPMFHGNSVSLPVWPVPPIPFSCSCCHVLREIIHVHGTNLTKLEIHGTLGVISHAILENRYGIDCNGNVKSEYQMFDFCKKSIENVREFLVQYCEDRRRSGHELIQDPLLVFYETMCVGLGLFPDDFLDIADFFPPNSPPPPPPPAGFNGGSGGANGNVNGGSGANGNGASTSGANANANANANGWKFPFFQQNQQQQQQQEQEQEQEQEQPPLEEQPPAPPPPPPAKQQQNGKEGGGGGRAPRRSPLALQRERTGRLAIGDLRGYFNLPMEVAARRINVCPTVMKKICRRGGLERWPYRKVNSLERKVIAKTIALNMKEGEERVRVQAEIDVLQKQINAIIAGLFQNNP